MHVLQVWGKHRGLLQYCFPTHRGYPSAVTQGQWCDGGSRLDIMLRQRAEAASMASTGLLSATGIAASLHHTSYLCFCQIQSFLLRVRTTNTLAVPERAAASSDPSKQGSGERTGSLAGVIHVFIFNSFILQRLLVLETAPSAGEQRARLSAISSPSEEGGGAGMSWPFLVWEPATPPAHCGDPCAFTSCTRERPSPAAPRNMLGKSLLSHTMKAP